jgi:thioredoxin-like negative regulator of GroEL
MRALGAMRSLVLALLVVAVAAQSPYPEDGLVRALTDDEFEAAVMENGREAWAIAFHTDGCAPCASMAPHFTKAAKSMRGIVNFGHVRLSEDGDSMEIARKVGLTRVPVVLGFPAHKLINPYGGPSAKQGVEYRNSTSSAKKIADFAASLLPDDVVTRVTTREALDEMRSFASPLGFAAQIPRASLPRSRRVRGGARERGRGRPPGRRRRGG